MDGESQVRPFESICLSFFTAIVYLFIEVAMILFQLVTRKERVASALHFNSYILLYFQLIPKSKLLAYKRRARCVAGLLKHGKVSRKNSNCYDIGAFSPNTRY